MPEKKESLPFPFGAASTTSSDVGAIKCPVCTASDFDVRTNQYGIMRSCNKCGNQWHGGSMAVARPDFSDPIPPPGVPVPDDIPVTQYTGAGFRDPSKSYDSDE
jgi:hypothetical protein